mmetsp:Transcript_14453/g.33057  ORF Transcript_14453/g.33057 Transcript_14453/m.33057 type:complete len:261 (+) Transcript_14453:408-1190(+)
MRLAALRLAAPASAGCARCFQRRRISRASPEDTSSRLEPRSHPRPSLRAASQPRPRACPLRRCPWSTRPSTPSPRQLPASPAPMAHASCRRHEPSTRTRPPLGRLADRRGRRPMQCPPTSWRRSATRKSSRSRRMRSSGAWARRGSTRSPSQLRMSRSQPTSTTEARGSSSRATSPTRCRSASTRSTRSPSTARPSRANLRCARATASRPSSRRRPSTDGRAIGIGNTVIAASSGAVCSMSGLVCAPCHRGESTEREAIY